MKDLVLTDVMRQRVAKWMNSAKPLDTNPTWIERRPAMEFGGHIYPIANGQVFQCAHCGHFDPEWSATEVLQFFERIGAKPIEIEVVCTVAVNE